MTTLKPTCKKRLMGDLRLLAKDPHDFIDVCPDETNLLLWNFLIKGPADSPYEGGYYIGQLIHSENYPFSPPDYLMLTPSGRFEVNKKICLTNSGFHTSDWSPMWNIHSLLTGFLSNMLEKGNDMNISHLSEPDHVIKSYATKSLAYNKKHHPEINKLFTRFLDELGDPKKEKEKEQETPSDSVPENNKNKVTEDTPEIIKEHETIKNNKPKVKVIVDIEKIINEPVDTSEFNKEFFDKIQKEYDEIVSKK